MVLLMEMMEILMMSVSVNSYDAVVDEHATDVDDVDSADDDDNDDDDVIVISRRLSCCSNSRGGSYNGKYGSDSNKKDTYRNWSGR